MKYTEELAKLLDMDDTAERARFISAISEKLEEDEAHQAATEILLTEAREEFNTVKDDYLNLKKEYMNQFMLKGQEYHDETSDAYDFEQEFGSDDVAELFK